MTYQAPDKNGFYGNYGGRFVPETLMEAVKELELAMKHQKQMKFFKKNWLTI